MFLFLFLNTAVYRNTNLLFILQQENPSVHGLFAKNSFSNKEKHKRPGFVRRISGDTPFLRRTIAPVFYAFLGWRMEKAESFSAAPIYL